MSRKYAAMGGILALVWCGACATISEQTTSTSSRNGLYSPVPPDSLHWLAGYSTFIFSPSTTSVGGDAALSSPLLRLKNRLVRDLDDVPFVVPAYRLREEPSAAITDAPSSLIRLARNSLEMAGYRYVTSLDSADVVISIRISNVQKAGFNIIHTPTRKTSVVGTREVVQNSPVITATRLPNGQTSVVSSPGGSHTVQGSSISRQVVQEEQMISWQKVVSSAWMTIENRVTHLTWSCGAWESGKPTSYGGVSPGLVSAPVCALLRQVPVRMQTTDYRALDLELGLALEFVLDGRFSVLPRIKSVRAESPAAIAGLRPGDVLEELDGKSFADQTWTATCRALLGARGQREAVRVQVIRKSRRESVDLRL